jgi:hypothetical protein
MECLKEIERFQKKIADAIIGLSHVTTDTTDDNDG